MTSLRQELVAAVLERFRGITTAAGYATDAGAHVFLFRTAPISQAELPAIVVRDRRVETELEGRAVHLHRFIFEADLYVAAGTDIRNLLADVQSAIGRDIRWNSAGKVLAVDTRPLDDETDSVQEERSITGCRLRFQVLQRTRPFNPFSLASPT